MNIDSALSEAVEGRDLDAALVAAKKHGYVMMTGGFLRDLWPQEDGEDDPGVVPCSRQGEGFVADYVIARALAARLLSPGTGYNQFVLTKNGSDRLAQIGSITAQLRSFRERGDEALAAAR